MSGKLPICQTSLALVCKWGLPGDGCASPGPLGIGSTSEQAGARCEALLSCLTADAESLADVRPAALAVMRSGRGLGDRLVERVSQRCEVVELGEIRWEIGVSLSPAEVVDVAVGCR